MDNTGSGRFVPRRVARSLAAVILGSMVLRAAAGAMGQNIQFYFNAIQAAALNPHHPLRLLAGQGGVYMISYTLGGLILGAFFVAELFGSLVMGAFSDRLGRRWFIILGPLFGAVAVLITSVTTAAPLLIITRLFEGLSTASSVPATLGYLAESTSHSPRLRTRISGMFEIATIGGTATGYSLGGWLWRKYGTAGYVAGVPLTSPAFAANALIYLASLVILWFGVSDSHAPSRNLRVTAELAADGAPEGEALPGAVKRYGVILRNGRIFEFALAWIAINTALGAWLNNAARILTAPSGYPSQILVGHFDSFHAGNVIAIYALFFVLGILLWSVLFSGAKKTTAMLIGAVGVMAFSLTIIALNHLPGLLGAPALGLAALLALCIMVLSGFTPAALAYLADITEPYTHDRGAIMGLYSVFLGLGQFLGAALGGAFADWRQADGLMLFTTLIGLFVLGLVLNLRSANPERRPENPVKTI